MLRGFWLGVALLAAGCGGDEGDQSAALRVADPPSTGEAGASGAEPVESPVAICEAGRQVECPCPNGGKGAQACASDGSKWEACLCADAKPPAPEKSPSQACGAPFSLSEKGCPVDKPVGFISNTCMNAYIESGICSPSPGATSVACCPAE